MIAYCRTHYTPKDAALPGVRLVRPALSEHEASRRDQPHHARHSPRARPRRRRGALPRAGPVVLGLPPAPARPQGRGHGAWAGLASREVGPGRIRVPSPVRVVRDEFPHVTIVVSRSLESHFRRAGAHSLRYIPNGTVLPTPAPAGPAEEMGFAPGRYLLFVGRLVPEKGLHSAAARPSRACAGVAARDRGGGALHGRLRRHLPARGRGQRAFPGIGLRRAPRVFAAARGPGRGAVVFGRPL